MGIYDELSKLSTASSPPSNPPRRKPKVEKKQPQVENSQSANQSTDRPIDQLTDRPIDPSTDKMAKQLISIDDVGPVIEKPRAFYITKKVDEWLDDAVRYLQGKGLYKVDRSILVNVLLHDPELFSPASLDRLQDQVLIHLTNKSLKRV